VPLEREPAPPPADDPPFMIPTSEPPTVIGVDGGNDPGTFRMEPEAAPFQTDAPEISMDAAAPPVVLMEPEPTVFMAPEASEPPPPPFVEPPIAPPPLARRQYDVPAPEPPPSSRAVPAPSRPSQEDLAALDQILNPKAERSAVLDKSVADAAARPSSRSGGKSGSRSARRGSSSRAPLFLGIGAVLALAAAAGWFFVLRPRGEGADARADASATATTAPAPVSAGTVPTRVPEEAPVAAPVAAAPPPATAPPAPGGDARALLQGGSYPEAARLFAADVTAAGRNAATIQLLIACSTETVQKAVANVGAMELLIVPHRYNDRDCYRLCWGLYPTTQAATAAVRLLPAYFEQPGVRPKVVRAAEIAP
jgi:septal ring-binding cell division protein DamX